MAPVAGLEQVVYVERHRSKDYVKVLGLGEDLNVVMLAAVGWDHHLVLVIGEMDHIQEIVIERDIGKNGFALLLMFLLSEADNLYDYFFSHDQRFLDYFKFNIKF